MKVYEHHKLEQLVSFEIRNVGRSRACRIVQKLFPASGITRQSGDEFATFELNGKTFVLEEPFGDNSRYLIYQQPPQPSAELNALMTAFAQAHVSWLFSGDKKFRVIVGILVLTMLVIALAIAVWLR